MFDLHVLEVDSNVIWSLEHFQSSSSIMKIESIINN